MSAPGDTGALRQAIAATALRQVGKPYIWGATGPNAFDCSGLIEYSYSTNGVSIPHNSVAQWNACQHVAFPDLADPVFLRFDADGPQHEAMYVGNGNVVVAPHTGAFVEVVPMSSFSGTHAFGSFLGTAPGGTPAPPAASPSASGAPLVGCATLLLPFVLAVLAMLSLAAYIVAQGSVA